MKVYDLACEQAHRFEAWFGSEADYQHQLKQGLLSCPLCGSQQLTKQLSAPRLNLKHTSAAVPADDQHTKATASITTSMQASTSTADVAPSNPTNALAADGKITPERQANIREQWQRLRETVRQTEDVGDQFADLARAMHHGDVEERAIRGRTTAREAIELITEGVAVLPLPPGLGLNETVQ